MKPTLLVAAATAWGCATVQPDEMSADQHRGQANAARAEAAREETKYDSSMTYTGPATTGRIIPFPEIAYNPTYPHLERARLLRGHADAHERAAKKLESFVKAECVQFSMPSRAECPLISQIASLQEITGGVRLFVRPGHSRDMVLAHFRCHYAFAQAEGFEELPSCPIYVKKLRIVAGPGLDTIDLISADDVATKEIRARFGAVVGPA